MMRRWIKYVTFIILLLILVGCGRPEAKYIFFFIGDGMGAVQMNAAERYLAAMENKPGIIPLAMNLAPATGSITTNSKNRYITDSGAAVTALSTGFKTTLTTISMDAEHRYPLKTIAETAKERGMKVGIISTVDIDHATPAGFYAHQPKRSSYYEIAKQLANSNFDFFGGGDIQQNTDPKGIDKENIIDLAKRNGFIYINNATAFNYLQPSAGRVFFVHPDVNLDYAMPYSIDMDKDAITLSQIVDKAIKMLDGPDGFFIMIESGKIDWACHANDAATSIHETLAFDDAIKVALEFYSKHEKNTLILITADHETGGMSMGTTHGDNNVDLSKLQWQTGSFNELTREYQDICDVLIEEYGIDSVKNSAQWAFDFVREQTGLG
ncbi:MAG: alkaline phosphatase, partial [Candidatus Marinimicrobia bacterium]|nr:alkaline phosphatase [Candidatus Neomarinimicrobiota bacterium]